MAMRSSVGVWMLTYVVVIAPTICWVKDDVYLHDEECDVLVLFHDQAEKNIRLLGIILTVIFVVVLLTLNSLIVASVFKRNRGFTSRKTVIQNLRIDSNIFRGPSSEQNETQKESISYGNVKRTKPRENTAGKIRKRLWPNPPRFLSTIADGIRLQQLGHLTFPIMLDLVEKEVFTIKDEDMIEGMKFSFQHMKLVIEAASGAAVAAAISDKLRNMDPSIKNIGVILCGGNVDINQLPWYSKS
ncbi:SRR [Mytilus edulis]|uniref:SRR n=1 Tax=Mytilus edulis TaxID=6550 RepID=A0A8S3TWV3_MYTED|nr:SRR [Mytilus edulis]